LSAVQAVANRQGEAPALLGVHEQLTYDGLAQQANRYARWALAQGLSPGDVVCLLMPNRPDYVAIWLGLTQVGCVVALLNTHLTVDALVHSIRESGASHVIVAGPLMRNVHSADGQLPAATMWWAHGLGDSAMPRIDLVVASHSGHKLDVHEQRLPLPDDCALWIYTSGTTGLPKAAKVTHSRIIEWSDWFAGMMDAQRSDRLFNCLPMYHSTGGVVAIGSMLVVGGSVVIRERFSASRFWDDVADMGCTIVQYIGELCRYLIQAPSHPREADHRVRLFCGNGLRAEVWPILQERFVIPRILEFYAATEGGVSLYNCEGMPGAIGRVPPFLAHRFSVTLIRCDPETGIPHRNAAGRCVPCGSEEPGEAIGQLDANGTSRRFDGYTNKAASRDKVLHDVFMPGDSWFRTGDLMRKDAFGYYYFVDRLGDTFRWKGENVSTTEVASVLNACPGVIETAVYGVTVPGTEGKAGMAALAIDDAFSLSAFRAHLHENLPPYARPLFIRICDSIETTGTFKLKKSELVRQGYTDTANDPIWFDDRVSGAFVKCDADFLARNALTL
jgi:fatty-acyl-CoA synthase